VAYRNDFFFLDRFLPFLSIRNNGFFRTRRAALIENGVNHPDRDQLTAFGHGKLGEADAQAIADHLAGWETCRGFLDNLADDALLALLRPLFTPGRRKPPPPADGRSGV
jgi:hypothetical protein